jgi:hypothetical protein
VLRLSERAADEARVDRSFETQVRTLVMSAFRSRLIDANFPDLYRPDDDSARRSAALLSESPTSRHREHSGKTEDGSIAHRTSFS